MTCEQCINQLFPDNPRIKTGRYNLSGCDYCDKLYRIDIDTESNFEPRPRYKVIYQRTQKPQDNYLYDRIKQE